MHLLLDLQTFRVKGLSTSRMVTAARRSLCYVAGNPEPSTVDRVLRRLCPPGGPVCRPRLNRRAGALAPGLPGRHALSEHRCSSRLFGADGGACDAEHHLRPDHCGVTASVHPSGLHRTSCERIRFNGPGAGHGKAGLRAPSNFSLPSRTPWMRALAKMALAGGPTTSSSWIKQHLGSSSSRHVGERAEDHLVLHVSVYVLVAEVPSTKRTTWTASLYTLLQILDR